MEDSTAWAETYFKRNNGYIYQNQKRDHEYLECHIDPELEEKWRQQLIQKQLKNLFTAENEVWIRLTILSDLLSRSSNDNTAIYYELADALMKTLDYPIWHKLLIMKVIVDSDNCLLNQLRAYPKLHRLISEKFEEIVHEDMQKEHENFQERYQHLYHRYLEIK